MTGQRHRHRHCRCHCRHRGNVGQPDGRSRFGWDQVFKFSASCALKKNITLLIKHKSKI